MNNQYNAFCKLQSPGYKVPFVIELNDGPDFFVR